MCTNPNYMLWTGEVTKNDKPKLRFLGHVNYDKLIEFKLPFIQVPCGQCLACRLQQTRQWADRCVLEAKKYKDNYFITLTYDDAHLPPNASLRPKDLQLFMKRLRRHFEGVKIRFLACGEYGTKTMRPHYHVLVFNCPLNDVIDVFQRYDPLHKRYVKYLRDKAANENLRHSKTIYDLWIDGKTKEHLGLISVGQFNYDTAAYVSQYVTKKTNPKMKQIYEDLHLVPEFLRMSNRPGIGADYFHDHDDGVYASHLIVPSPGEAHKSCVPRYFDKLFVKKYGDDVFSPVRAKRLQKRIINIDTYFYDDRKHFDEDNKRLDYKLRKRQFLKSQI